MYILRTIVPRKYMPIISAVGIFCCDKFEETPNEKVSNMSKLIKFYFSSLLIKNSKVVIFPTPQQSTWFMDDPKGIFQHLGILKGAEMSDIPQGRVWILMEQVHLECIRSPMESTGNAYMTCTIWKRPNEGSLDPSRLHKKQLPCVGEI